MVSKSLGRIVGGPDGARRGVHLGFFPDRIEMLLDVQLTQFSRSVLESGATRGEHDVELQLLLVVE